MTVTWQSHSSHESHDSHMTVTWQSHGSTPIWCTVLVIMRVTWQLPFLTCTRERSTSFFLQKTSNLSPSNTLLRWSRRDNPSSPFPCCCDHSFLTLIPTSCKGSSPRVLKRSNYCIQWQGLFLKGTTYVEAFSMHFRSTSNQHLALTWKQEPFSHMTKVHFV